MNSELTLVGARTWCGSRIPVYDDGFGDVWLYREASGLMGIVRSLSWHDAYACCQDEIMTRVDGDEVIEAYGFYVIGHRGSFWLISDVELKQTSTRWESFQDEFPGRVVVGAYATQESAIAHCQSIIEEEQLDLIEGYEYQPNSTGTGIVSIDLNGTDLRPLTAELRSELGIVLEVTQLC